MKKCVIAVLAGMMISGWATAQTKPADTVVIKVGEGSKIVFTIRDKKDLETLKKYDLQALVNDLVKRLEQKDTVSEKKPSSDYLITPDTARTKEEKEEDWFDRERDNEDNEKATQRWSSRKRTYHSFNFDIGTNNYLSSGSFPDADNSAYTVKPWGSWYIGLNSVQRTRLANKFFLEWGLGVSWYNFKFQDERTIVTKDDSQVYFTADLRDLDFKKSRLTATYVNATIVPMIDFGANKRKSSFFDGNNSESFRIGAGGYIGYRVDSFTKQIYREDGRKRDPKNHDNFYLNNLRYGLRLQVGFDDVDLFFNYDLNELFTENKGPKLNAFSFGVTF